MHAAGINENRASFELDGLGIVLSGLVVVQACPKCRADAAGPNRRFCLAAL